MDSRSPSPSPREPSPPFDDRKADAILHSCDGVDFRVYRSILAQASPFFDDMFTLPQPPKVNSAYNSSSSDDSSDEEDEIPVIPVTEDKRTLDSVLRMCYHMNSPVLEELWHAEQVLEAGRKYQMDWVYNSTRGALIMIAQRKPLEVYAIACRYGLVVEAMSAARASLRLSIHDVMETLTQEGIDAESMRALMRYRSACCEAVVPLMSDWSWILSLPRKFWNTHTCCTRTTVRDRVGRVYQIQPWWIRYMSKVARDLRNTPCDSVVDAREALGLYMSQGTCGKCLAVSVDHITSFANILQRRIAERIARVQLQT